MKRILSILLAVLMAFTTITGAAMLLPGSIEASTTEKTFDGSFSAKGGDTVTVNVELNNNPGILGATLKLNYDTRLTLKSATNGEAFSVLTLTQPGKLVDGCKFVWDGMDLGSTDIKNGTVLILSFEVPSTIADDNTFDFYISYEEGDIVNSDLEALSPEFTFNISGGTTIEDPSDPTDPTDPSDPVEPTDPADPTDPSEQDEPEITSEGNIYTGSFVASNGDEVSVNVQIKNNPGILGATLKLEFDNGLQLNSATNGDAFSALTLTNPGQLISGCKFVWDGMEISSTDIKNGTILTLNFKVTEKSVTNKTYSFTMSYEDGDVVNTDLESVSPVLSFEVPQTHTHSFASTWTYNDEYHWHTCSGCSEISGKAKHEYDNDQDTTCNVCGAVREVEPEIVNVKLELDNKKVVAGDTFTVNLNVTENLGFAYLEVSPKFDDELSLESIKNGDVVSEFTNMSGSNNYFWLNEENVTKTGTLATMTFKISEEAEIGEYNIGFVIRKCATANEKIVNATLNGGKVSVIDFVYGDANGDGVVDGLDLIRLKRYVAYFNYDTNTSSIEVNKGADANGDGTIDGLDLIRLKRYIAYYDYDTGASTIELGPQS